MKNISVIILIIIVLLVTLTNRWFYRIIDDHLILGLIVLTLSFAIASGLAQLLSRKLLYFTYGSLIAFSIFFSISHYEEDLIKHNALDINNMKVRQGYYTHRMGPIVHNNLTVTVYKIQRNFFTNLNFNQFFFGGEPRYRPYALDFEKFPPVYLGFFLYGLYCIFKQSEKLLKIFLSASIIILLILSFGNPSFILGIYPLYPLITGIISLGILEAILGLINYIKT